MSERIEKARAAIARCMALVGWTTRERAESGLDAAMDELIAAVEERERERCAKVAESLRGPNLCEGGQAAATAIRARGGK